MTQTPTLDKWGNSLAEWFSRSAGALKAGTFFAVVWPLIGMALLALDKGLVNPPDRPFSRETTAPDILMFILFGALFLGFFAMLFRLGWKYARTGAGWIRAGLSGMIPAVPAILLGTALEVSLYLNYDPFAAPGKPETGAFLMIFPLVFIFPAPFVAGLGGLARALWLGFSKSGGEPARD